MDRKIYFSAYQLKLLAVAAMTLDHIAWAFVPLNTWQAQLMHFIGRLTAPLMCCFTAEGLYHTRNLRRYLGRMAVFALLSAPAYSYFILGGQLAYAGMGMIYTLFLGLAAAAVQLRTSWPRPVKQTVILLLGFLSLDGDWMVTGFLWVYFFAIYRGQPKQQFRAYQITAACTFLFYFILSAAASPATWQSQLFQLGMFLAPPLLKCYNGELGGRKGGKWFFYLFYPAHLLLLGWLQAVISL